jgi:divalent metal cation (Fe/Co/Zn/Cd) transporter
VTPVELPTLAPAASTPGPAAPLSRQRYEQLAHRARLLSWFSLAWMTVEGAVAIGAGIAASSIALAGFGIDSAIEGVASLIIVWRFTGSRLASEQAEERAQKLVAITFFLLAPYIAIEALRDLIGGHHPDVSWLGIGLAATSLILMPVLGVAKQRIGERIGSAATKGEGAQNLLCAYMAAALLVGLLANAAFGLWWLDPGAALVIAALALNEGVESWRGESCGCIPAATAPSDGSCRDSCS